MVAVDQTKVTIKIPRENIEVVVFNVPQAFV
jgi:hypothetical protein